MLITGHDRDSDRNMIDRKIRQRLEWLNLPVGNLPVIDGLQRRAGAGMLFPAPLASCVPSHTAVFDTRD
jgi:hypothetical protein